MLAHTEWPLPVQQALTLALTLGGYESVLPSAEALLASMQRPAPAFVDAVLGVLLHPPPALSRHKAHALAALMASCVTAGTPWQPKADPTYHTALWCALRPGPGLEARAAGTACVVARCGAPVLSRLLTEVGVLDMLLVRLVAALQGEGSDADTGFGRAGSGAEYEVSAIVAHRLKDNKLEYKVSWRGYDARWNEWLSVADLSCQQLMSVYHETKPLSAEELVARERNLQRPSTNPIVRVLGRLLADGVQAVADLHPTKVPSMAFTIGPYLCNLIPTLQLRLLRLLQPPAPLTDALLISLFFQRSTLAEDAVDAHVSLAKVGSVILNLRVPTSNRSSRRSAAPPEPSGVPTAFLLAALVHALVSSLPAAKDIDADTLMTNFNAWHKAVRDGTRALPGSEREFVNTFCTVIEKLLRESSHG